MSKTSFQNVIVIGYGAIAYNALRLCNEKSLPYGYELMYIEHEPYPFNAAQHYATTKGIMSAVLEKKEDVVKCLLDKTEEQKTLIISAGNNYLFPQRIVEQKNTTIINFHNSLLPKYPVRNAASWAIYCAEKETGITWHYVSTGIDDGDIIVQKSCVIPENVKAYELAEMLMDLGIKGLSECLDSVLQETVQAKKQPTIEKRTWYKSSDVPGGGIIHAEDKPEEIYRLLRAMDYGPHRIFPLPKMIHDGQEVSVIGYGLVSNDAPPSQSNTLCFPYNDGKTLMVKYE